MTQSLNEVNLIGYVGQDPEFKDMGSDKKMCKFSIATPTAWRDKQTGELKSHSEWHTIVVWNEYLHPMIKDRITKGARVFVRGEKITRKYKDKHDIERVVCEVSVRFNGMVQFMEKPGGPNNIDRSGDLDDQDCSAQSIEFEIPFA